MNKEHLPESRNAEQPVNGRTQAEMKARIEELETKIKEYDVWIHKGYSSVPEPRAQRKQDLFRAKLNELRWIAGEDITVTDGIY